MLRRLADQIRIALIRSTQNVSPSVAKRPARIEHRTERVLKKWSSRAVTGLLSSAELLKRGAKIGPRLNILSPAKSQPGTNALNTISICTVVNPHSPRVRAAATIILEPIRVGQAGDQKQHAAMNQQIRDGRITPPRLAEPAQAGERFLGRNPAMT
ncbi:MAG TPA: hypothetical protein VNM72_02675 [Blastocatellia bacterium]|nr:hypothetical protein [Blastocatellia bacterium]